MTGHDPWGNPLSPTDHGAVEAYATALAQLHCFRGDPVATIDAATAAQPAFVMGHVLHAWLHLLGTEPAGTAVALADLQRIDALPMNLRESGHAIAIRHVAAGRWRAGGRVLEDVAIEYPHDALALQAGHLVDFYLGDSRMLRDRIARALPAWDGSQPGYHALLGMHAFGLEETGAYARAEAQGRSALELEPCDAWAHHAVVHVMEMQGRSREGIDFVRGRTPQWADENSLAVHNWWHLALFHLDQDDVEAALALFDGPVCGGRLALDLVDASALLWRLQLRGVELGERWHPVADAWTAVGGDGAYAFNDAHAMMANLGGGRADAVRGLLAAQRDETAAALDPSADNRAMRRDVGVPLLQALDAFARREFAPAVALLRQVRPVAQRFGGSHAQRDLIDLTLVEAALRGGPPALARALVAERLDRKPGSPAERRLGQRAAG